MFIPLRRKKTERAGPWSREGGSCASALGGLRGVDRSWCFCGRVGSGPVVCLHVLCVCPPATAVRTYLKRHLSFVMKISFAAFANPRCWGDI